MSKIKALMGFATKAGKLISGSERVLDSIRFGKAGLVIIATDLSDASKKRFNDKADYYAVPIISPMTMDEISKTIGKSGIGVCAVTDEGFAGSILKEYNNISMEVLKDE